MTLKEAHARARDAVRSAFIAKGVWDAEKLADELLSKIRAEFHAAGFVMVPKVPTKEMMGIAPWNDAQIIRWEAILAARPKLEDTP